MQNKMLLSGLVMSFGILLSACAEQAKETAEKKEREEETGTSGEEHVHWSYEGNSGPENWGSLNEDFLACEKGSAQSPVNIESAKAGESGGTNEIQMNYQASEYSLLHTGHTIQLNPKSGENTLEVDDSTYQLVQFHFHTPSEHQFDGEHHEMELHLVHENEEGQLAVAGIMIEEGEENEQLASVWNSLPEKQSAEEMDVKSKIDAGELLPEEEQVVRYDGSLTTPPCTEEVKWMVFEDPINMSKEQIDSFQDLFPNNSRPVQPVNERELLKDAL
ncbi:carbonic anhydrase [Bacillus massiliglaciei]|uniref:carbonic anhydrase n=1 Tax=Bacillus massiliglaciei TaxID=1816693 RepID=UPI000B296EF2|nr:carbonic anhydrase family protein [Bacillus massiliglaciei]